MFVEPECLEKKMIPIKLIYLKHNPTVKKLSRFKREPTKRSLLKPNESVMVKFLTGGIFNGKEIEKHFENFSHAWSWSCWSSNYTICVIVYS